MRVRACQGNARIDGGVLEGGEGLGSWDARVVGNRASSDL